MGIKSIFRNLFYPNTEQRAIGGYPPSDSFRLTDPTLAGLLTMNSGTVSVNYESVLGLATLYRCVDVLASSFASLPWDLYQSDGLIRKVAIGHPVRRTLLRPNKLQTSYIFRKTLFVYAMLRGNGVARIVRNGNGRPVSYKLYHPDQVTISTDTYRDTLTYRFPDVAQTLGSDDVIHYKLFSTDGLIGRSVVQMMAETFKVPMQTQRFSSKLLENGARPAGIIKSKQKLSTTAQENIKGGWFGSHGGVEKVGGVAVLAEDMDYQSIGINPVDAQLLQVMQWSDEKICAAIGVPQHMAGILTHSTNNNIEHQGIEFVMHSLRPHVVNFEEEFDYKALLSQEFGTFYTKLNLNGLLRGDLAARQSFYQSMRNSGIMNANEIRDLEDLNPYTGGETYYIQGAMVPIDSTTGLPIYPPKAQTSAPLNGHKLTEN